MSKYNSKKTVVDGITFDSRKESERYVVLKTMEEKGRIKDLKLQPTFELQPSFKKNGTTFRKITYKADFSYYDIKKGKMVVEDVKSNFTAKDKVFCLKRKMFEYNFQDLELEIVI